MTHSPPSPATVGSKPRAPGGVASTGLVLQDLILGSVGKEAYCEHPTRFRIADVDGGAILLDQENRVEACVGLPVHSSERGSVAVSPPRGCIQVAAALRGQPLSSHAARAGCRHMCASQWLVPGPEWPHSPAPVGAHSNVHQGRMWSEQLHSTSRTLVGLW